MIVTEKIADRFLAALAGQADNFGGRGPDRRRDADGSRRQRFGAQEHPAGIDSAIAKQGGAVLIGGTPYGDGPLAEGYFVAPTVVELSKPADIWSEELFGPVLAVRRPPMPTRRSRCQ